MLFNTLELSTLTHIVFLLYLKILWHNKTLISFINSILLFRKELKVSKLVYTILPIGINFEGLNNSSYSFKVYRKQLGPTENVLLLFRFMLFSFQFVVNPFKHFLNLLPHMYKKHQFNYNWAKSVLLLKIFEFFKEMAIADNLAILSNQVYATTVE